MQKLHPFHAWWIAACICLAACKKTTDNNGYQPLPPAQGTAVTVVLHPDKPGFAIPAAFLGFSYETGLLPDSSFLNIQNQVLLQLYKNLGQGIIRVGGNSSDRLVWTGGPRNAASGNDSLTTTDIDRFSAFAQASGWQVLFGLNLGNYNIAKAVDEARYVSSRLGGSLAALQTGNEVDLFSRNGHRTSAYNYTAYQQEWDNYFNAIRPQLPGIAFAGPDAGYNTSWISSFAAAEHANIRLLDGHYYRTGPASDSSITYHTILAKDGRLPNYLTALNTSASKYQLGYSISECNSVSDGGKKGVSDVFASALWALDYMWTVASYHGQGINFHGGAGGAYTPVARTNGTITARPEYYAMLAFKAGSSGSIIPADVDLPQLNGAVYACTASQSTCITLINKEEQQNISFTIQPGRNIAVVEVVRMTAPSLTATDGVQFANSQVDASGKFTPGAPEKYTGNSSNGFIVNVPAGSAAVVTIH